MLIYSFAHDRIALWLLGVAWSWGFIGVWGPVTVSDPHPRRRHARKELDAISV